MAPLEPEKGGGHFDPEASPLATNMSPLQGFEKMFTTFDRSVLGFGRLFARALGIGVESPERSEDLECKARPDEGGERPNEEWSRKCLKL